MDGTINNAFIAVPEPIRSGPARAISEPGVVRQAAQGVCFHCGEPCPDGRFAHGDKVFCCQGCLVVHDLLAENGLERFYDLSRHPGVRVQATAGRQKWAYLDEAALQKRLLDFTDGKLSRLTLRVPAIHCVACVWLLENLFRLHPGIGRTRVNFARREVSLQFAPARIALSELVALLCAIGYEPELTLEELEQRRQDPARKRRWLQVGIAGFAFGNIMLFSLPSYFGLDSFSGPLFRRLFGGLSLGLALPVVVYSASDYWRQAWVALRQRVLTLEVPIAAGLAALYLQSAYMIISGRGEGFLDSLAGLVFFLLCGRVFQQKTFDRMAFDRDYKCFFPLAATRLGPCGEESVSISSVQVGDRLVLRSGEIVPADARLVGGVACIDYSFVSGESEPVVLDSGAALYAGGRQTGGRIEVETVRAVSQSYLTSLWDDAAFRKPRDSELGSLTNRFSKWFTRTVIVLALGTVLFWLWAGDGQRGLKALISVLIVACPCALALAAPFALGTAQRLLARRQIFLRNIHVLERLARVNTIVFDKTGTLTEAGGRSTGFTPVQGDLSADERGWAAALASASTHPQSVRIAGWLGGGRQPVAEYQERAGRGLAGRVAGHGLRLGSRGWLAEQGIGVPALELPAGGVSWLAIDGVCRGAFVVTHALRPRTAELLGRLGRECEIILLSGDNERERERFGELFGDEARLHFNQSPQDKLGFVRRLQEAGGVVMMVGDGLNDAGALRQSDVGVAVVEQVGAFSPASDVILASQQVGRLFELLLAARRAVRVVHLSFGLSAFYNLVGVSIAAAGVLSPVISAVLMPVSSISVVVFACGAARWTTRAAMRSPEEG